MTWRYVGNGVLLAAAAIAAIGGYRAIRQGVHPHQSSQQTDRGDKSKGDDTIDCHETCGRLTQIGKVVAEVRIPAPPPKPAGGIVRSGTYVLTEMTEYTGAGGATGLTGHERAFTLRADTSVSPTRVDTAYVHAIDGCVDYWQGGTLTTSDIWLKASVSCWTGHATPQEVNQAYTASEDTLLIFTSPTNIWKFEHQP